MGILKLLSPDQTKQADPTQPNTCSPTTTTGHMPRLVGVVLYVIQSGWIHSFGVFDYRVLYSWAGGPRECLLAVFEQEHFLGRRTWSLFLGGLCLLLRWLGGGVVEILSICFFVLSAALGLVHRVSLCNCQQPSLRGR